MRVVVGGIKAGKWFCETDGLVVTRSGIECCPASAGVSVRYPIGETVVHTGPVELCEAGLHFAGTACRAHLFYPFTGAHIGNGAVVVEAGGKVAWGGSPTRTHVASMLRVVANLIHFRGLIVTLSDAERGPIDDQQACFAWGAVLVQFVDGGVLRGAWLVRRCDYDAVAGKVRIVHTSEGHLLANPSSSWCLFRRAGPGVSMYGNTSDLSLDLGVRYPPDNVRDWYLRGVSIQRDGKNRYVGVGLPQYAFRQTKRVLYTENTGGYGRVHGDPDALGRRSKRVHALS